MKVESYQVKKIKFEDYIRYFKDILGLAEDSRVIFYKRTEDRIVISFSYDNFIIITERRLSDIVLEYESDANYTPYEITQDETGEHPAIVKFLAEYLERGIPEDED